MASRLMARRKQQHQGHDAKEERNNKKRDLEDNGRTLLNRVVPKTAGQEILMDSIEQNDIVLCDGPAGCGKTYLAFGAALDSYFKGIHKRIIIVRPTLTAGDDDNIGYLPGDLHEKMLPFLAPLIKDSATQLLKPELFRSFGKGIADPMLSLLTKIDIEVVPLSFIRGRTFNSCFCILDEAQNCTLTDLKLFLTRIGRGSKTVIEGDSTQSDRDDGGLVNAMQRLSGLENVGIVQLNDSDIIRNPLISHILRRLG